MTLAGWWIFGGRKRARAEHVEKIAERATIEIIAHKEVQEKVAERAERVNKELKELIEENGFHVAIFLGAGGKLKGTEHTKRGKAK